MKHNGQLGATVEQYIGVETRLLGQPAATTTTAPTASGPPDGLGTWGVGAVGIERAAEASCST